MSSTSLTLSGSNSQTFNLTPALNQLGIQTDTLAPLAQAAKLVAQDPVVLKRLDQNIEAFAIIAKTGEELKSIREEMDRLGETIERADADIISNERHGERIREFGHNASERFGRKQEMLTQEQTEIGSEKRAALDSKGRVDVALAGLDTQLQAAKEAADAPQPTLSMNTMMDAVLGTKGKWAASLCKHAFKIVVPIAAVLHVDTFAANCGRIATAALSSNTLKDAAFNAAGGLPQCAATVALPSLLIPCGVALAATWTYHKICKAVTSRIQTQFQVQRDDHATTIETLEGARTAASHERGHANILRFRGAVKEMIVQKRLTRCTEQHTRANAALREEHLAIDADSSAKRALIAECRQAGEGLAVTFAERNQVLEGINREALGDTILRCNETASDTLSLLDSVTAVDQRERLMNTLRNAVLGTANVLVVATNLQEQGGARRLAGAAAIDGPRFTAIKE